MKLFRHLTALAIAALLALGPSRAHAQATLLPPGEQCFQATSGISGMVGVLGTITGGAAYTNGTYSNVALTGGSGSGATANITVGGGAVTAVTILNPGIQYVVADVLSATAASIGGTGAGFSVPVNSVSINSSLAGGTVAFYIPNTLTFKQTYKNAAGTINNTNPVALDQNGCAIIYGTGIYRQILKDSVGNTVWDQLTTDTSASNSVFWAGIAGGTPNVITVTDVGFNGTDGVVLQFIALSTNTGSVTINPSGFGAIGVLKDTTAGPVSLTGGEIIAGNVVSVVYSASGNAFHLINSVIQSASGASAPLCGATGLKITNGSTPNTIIALTADQIVMQTTNGLTINRSNVSLLAINTTIGNVTSTANGMDGEVPGISQWLNIWAIDNGAAPAGLVSVSATAPTMPSGYSYKCRLGAMRVDGAGNLLRNLQVGNRGHYVVTAATNTTAFPLMTSGNNALVYTAVSVSNFIPPTASSIFVIPQARGNGASATQEMDIASNSGFSTGSGSPPPPWQLSVPNSTTPIGSASILQLILETTNIYYASTNMTVANLSAEGWLDKVNAN